MSPTAPERPRGTRLAATGPVVTVILRLVVGATFLYHGLQKLTGWFHGPGLDGTKAMMEGGGWQHPSLAAARQAGAATINFGLFINNVISFTIVAFVLFMAIKGMNQLRRKQEEDPQSEPPPSREVQLLEEIRDALVKRG